MTDRDNVVAHLQIINVWADVGKTYNGIEPEACVDVEKWTADAIKLLKVQEAEIRQLRLALDIAKGTCNGIKAEGR